jgi:Uncharacterized protein conserved in bacteria
MNSDDLSIQDILKIRRNELGLSQQQLSDIIGINIRFYQRLEAGERTLNNSAARIVVAIADILELDVHELVNTPSVDEYLKNKEEFERLQIEAGREE